MEGSAIMKALQGSARFHIYMYISRLVGWKMRSFMYDCLNLFSEGGESLAENERRAGLVRGLRREGLEELP